ncbi:MAG: class I SAM-dependent methyltransferase [Opitutaceae bacterium]
MSVTPPRERWLELLRAALTEGTFIKLTLGKPGAADPTLRNLFARPVQLRAGARVSLTWRHATREVTRNLPSTEAADLLAGLLGTAFLDAHLFTATGQHQFETNPGGRPRLRSRPAPPGVAPPPPGPHDRTKDHVLPSSTPWLQDLGVTNPDGRPRAGMAGKLSQIQHFASLLQPLLRTAFPAEPKENRGDGPLEVIDAGSGKGYLTFALAQLLGPGFRVRGLEARPELVAFANAVACRHGLQGRLSFAAGRLDPTRTEPCDLLIALHACDTATDDALALGIRAGARLLVVAPCCQHELRPALAAPPGLEPVWRHGIFRERHAEFATDALRALLLEWSGYATQVAEFTGAEHTAKNLLLSGLRQRPPGDAAKAAAVREFAAAYGIRAQALARHLEFPLRATTAPPA